MEFGESFCSACGRPSIWATHDERVAWEVQQWRALNGPKRQEIHTPILSVRALRDSQRAPDPALAESEPAAEAAPQAAVAQRAPEPIAEPPVVASEPQPVAPVLEEVLAYVPEPVTVPEPIAPVTRLRSVPEPVVHEPVVHEPVVHAVPEPSAPADPLDDTLALLGQINERLAAIETQLVVLNRSRWTRFRTFLARVYAFPES